MFLGAVFGGIWEAIKWVWDKVYVPYVMFITDLFMKIFGGIGTAFSWIYDNIFVPYISTLSTILMAVFSGIGDALTWVYDTIISPVIDGITRFFGMIGWAFSNFGFLLQTALNGAVGMINNILDYVPGMCWEYFGIVLSNSLTPMWECV